MAEHRPPETAPPAPLVAVRVSLGPTDILTAIIHRDAARVLADEAIYTGTVVEVWELGAQVDLARPPVPGPAAGLTADQAAEVAF